MDASLLETFQRLGVVSKGHFLLSSGRHSDEYWEKFRLLEWPRITEQVCRSMAERYVGQTISAVVGPTTGGALLAQEVARQLDTRCLLAEPASGGGRELRRGFQLHAAEPILIVDDVLTTGLSLRETLSAVEPFQPQLLGIAVVIDRSGGLAPQQIPIPCHALLSIIARTFLPEDCPMCAAHIPVVKPGTRGSAIR